jgi:RNA polymerase sigma factor (sigma-70 family)
MERAPNASLDDLLAHAGWLRALASALISDPAEAEDLVQDTWLAAARHPPRADRPPRAWLARVITNLAHNRRRDAAHRAHREQEASRPESVHGSSDVDREIEMQRALVDALGALDETQRATIVRHYFHGVAYAEIARDEHVSESTVRNRASRALESLRAKLDQRYRDRGAWLALLAPIANRASETAAVPASSTSPTIAGALAMSAIVKTSAALAAAAALTWFVRRAIEPSPPTPSFAIVQHASGEELETPRVDTSSTAGDSQARQAIATAAEARPSATDFAPPVAATDELPGILRARIVESNGAPIAGAALTITDRLSEITRDEAPRANTDAGGRAHLDVHRSDRLKNRGVSAAMATDEWTLEVECSAPAHESKRSTVHIKAGQTTELGDVALLPGGALRGRVVIAAADPRPKIWVNVIPPELTLEERRQAPFHDSSSKRLAGSTTVVGDGTYTVTGVPIGHYRLIARVAYSDEWLQPLSDVVEVGAGETVDVPDLEITRNPFVITGTVRDPEGHALHGVDVEYRWAHSSGPGMTHWVGVSSDNQGRFVIGLEHEAVVDIYFVDPREKWGELVLHGVTTGRTDVDVRLPEAVWMNLRVEDGQHAPIDEYGVGIRHVGESDRSSWTSRRHPDGRERVFVRGDPCELLVSAPGRAEKVLGPFDVEHHPESITVVLDEERPALRVLVTADGKPVAKAHIELRTAVESTKRMSCSGFPVHALHAVDFWWEETDTEGRWSPSHVDDGRYIVVASVAGFARAQSRPFVIGGDAKLDEITLELSRGGSVQGRVIEAPDATAAGVLVAITNGDGYLFTTRSDAEGAFHFDTLAAGHWFLRHCEREYDPGSEVNAHEASGFDPSLTTFDVSDGQTTSCDLDLRAAACALHGVITLGNAAPRAWSVDLLAAGSEADASIGTTTDAEGRFQIQPMVLGPHRLRLATSTADDRDQRIECAVEIARGANEWSLSFDTGSIDGECAPNATVVHTWKDGRGATCTTRVVADSQGRFHVDAAPSGTARIAVQRTKLDALDVQIEVKAGETAHVSLR